MFEKIKGRDFGGAPRPTLPQIVKNWKPFPKIILGNKDIYLPLKTEKITLEHNVPLQIEDNLQNERNIIELLKR